MPTNARWKLGVGTLKSDPPLAGSRRFPTTTANYQKGL